MVARVLVIGGYGNFGSYIAGSLAPEPQIQLLIGGRAKEKARAFATRLGGANPAEGHAIDIGGDLAAALGRTSPDIVIQPMSNGSRYRQRRRVDVVHRLQTMLAAVDHRVGARARQSC
jgi:saccharopine dehydrogenase-like NADP-dependent oxidoreductase